MIGMVIGVIRFVMEFAYVIPPCGSSKLNANLQVSCFICMFHSKWYIFDKIQLQDLSQNFMKLLKHLNWSTILNLRNNTLAFNMVIIVTFIFVYSCNRPSTWTDSDYRGSSQLFTFQHHTLLLVAGSGNFHFINDSSYSWKMCKLRNMQLYNIIIVNNTYEKMLSIEQEMNIK